MRISVLGTALLATLASTAAWADVSLRDTDGFSKRGVANTSKNEGKQGPAVRATGAIALTDAVGVEYFINSDITFSTSSSASGAASEASYVSAVQADTSGGGFVSSTLNDSFDGYNTACVSIGVPAQCTALNRGAPEAIYNRNGAATADASCTETPAGGAAGPRNFVFPAQAMTLGTATVSTRREVYVPANDSFARWTTLVTNTGASAVTVNVIAQSNLGSDANTRVVSSSDADAVAEPTDAWVTSFQNFSGTTSSDPRLGHVVRGDSAPAMNLMQFVDGDDNPLWSFPITLNPGETKSVMYYVTAQGTRAAAAAKAAQLSALSSPSALNCMSPAERAQVANFAIAAPAPAVRVPAGLPANWLLLGVGLLASGLWFGRRLFAR